MPTRRSFMAAAVLAAGLATMGASPAVAQKNYNIASMADFTGPYADVMTQLTGARWAVARWWNAEVGKDLGVKVTLKDYDHRYDAAQVSSLWPGMAALQNRLPDDRIPMIMSIAGYGFAWLPDPWIFNPRPTYGHEAAAFYQWYHKEKGIDGPLKIGIISSEASPAYVDIHKGSQ